MDSKYFTTTCSVCGRVFHAARKHADTCSDKCRKAKSRSRVGQALKRDNEPGETLSYLDYLVTHPITMPTPEEWGND